MAKTAFARSNEVAAAWINVEPMLAVKVRGDDLLRAEIKLAAGGVAVERLEAKVRRHFLKRGIDLIPIIGEGWHIPTDEEQVRERAEHHRTKARRETKRELHAAISVDVMALSPMAARERELHIRRAGAAITAHRETSEERTAILGTSPALPRLLPK